MKRPLLPLIIVALVLWACAPSFSRNSLDQVETSVSFQTLLRDPEQYKGKIVMWGGEILQSRTEVKETWVEVLQKPLDWQHRPQDTDVSYGRFFIQFLVFQDPAIYAPGRKITVIGEVQGKIIQKIEDLDYSYPVIAPRETHLWRPESASGPFFHFGVGIGTVIR